MNREEKISFAYPSLVADGVHTKELLTPDFSMFINKNKHNRTIAVTAGFLMKSIGFYLIEVEITRDGMESSPVKKDMSQPIEMKSMHRIENGLQLVVYTMYSSENYFDEEGFYKVFTRFYHSVDGEKSGESIDEKECFFYVSFNGDK